MCVHACVCACISTNSVILPFHVKVLLSLLVIYQSHLIICSDAPIIVINNNPKMLLCEQLKMLLATNRGITRDSRIIKVFLIRH